MTLHDYAPKRRRNQHEASLQKFTVQALTLYRSPHVLAFSIPNEDARSPATGAKLKAMGMYPGIADLCIVIFGRVHFLELKHGNNQLTKAQRAFRAECERLGLPHRVARTPEEVCDILTGWRAFDENPLLVPSQARKLAMAA